MNSRVFYTLIRLAVVCAALGLAAGCDDVSTAELKTPVYKTGLKDSDDNKTSAFRKDFPLQAASYDRNNESTFMSKYKGSVNFMKNDDVDPLPEGYKQAAQPYLKNLWLGYPFMYEYREARGHTYAIHDILEIDRINRYGEKVGQPFFNRGFTHIDAQRHRRFFVQCFKESFEVFGAEFFAHAIDPPARCVEASDAIGKDGFVKR